MEVSRAHRRLDWEVADDQDAMYRAYNSGDLPPTALQTPLELMRPFYEGLRDSKFGFTAR